jgi:hypothetical protein
VIHSPPGFEPGKFFGSLLPLDFYFVYSGLGRSPVQKAEQLLQRRFRPFGHNFDGAVRFISDPTGQVKTAGGQFCAVAKKDALNKAVNGSFETFHEIRR